MSLFTMLIVDMCVCAVYVYICVCAMCIVYVCVSGHGINQKWLKPDYVVCSFTKR